MSAPDPADYGRLPGDGDFIRGIPQMESLAAVPADQRYDHAQRRGLIRNHTGGVTRRVVNLPADSDIQLGTRWRFLLTQEQLSEAGRRGMFNNLMAGHDPDAEAATP